MSKPPIGFSRRGACFIMESWRTGMIRGKKRIGIVLIAAVYLILHLLSLQLHPFVHSDEAWLASLSRSIMVEGSAAATEDFFRLTGRYPHALKIFYHILQMPFLSISWSAPAARLPSLLAGLSVLYLMYRTASALGLKKGLKYLPLVLIAIDPQFWYLSHLARQEMLLIALFCWSVYLKVRGRAGYMVALPLAAAVFVHPNSFIIAVGVGSLYLPGMLGMRKDDPEKKILTGFLEALSFALTLALAAAAAVSISFIMDSEFLAHYRTFGDSVGTGDSLVVKFLGLPRFLMKMSERRAGTYYLPEVRPFFLAGIAGYLCIGFASFFRRIRKRPRKGLRNIPGLLLIIPFLLSAMVFIGKYGPPTIGFLMPPAYLLFTCGLAYLIRDPGDRSVNGAVHIRSRIIGYICGLTVALLFLWSSVSTGREVSASVSAGSYRDYRNFLNGNIDSSGRVLMNLNGAFAFEYDRMVIWRDLSSLETGQSLEKFLDEQDVRWIVIPGELQIIYRDRPVWNNLYGNPAWYPELLEIVESRGIPVARESFPSYAMRIVPFMDRDDWQLQIYRID